MRRATLWAAASLLGGWALSNLAIAAEPTPDPQAIGRGARAWAEQCARCHNMRDARELRDDQWRPVVMHMRVRAGLTGQQARDILRFLQESN
jgi:mono/diheme cytochrome c family protein